MSEYILEVQDLKQHFPIRGGVLLREVARVHAVDGVSMRIRRGETVGIVGESGCGKSTLGRTVMKLYDPTAGKILFRGKDITRLSDREMRPLRRNMQMIFQDPYSSLNIRHSVGQIIEEPLIIHGMGSAAERKKVVDGLLERVGLPASAAYRFPHEFSGGQRQRIGIARAMTLNPELVICDEPVSALDVSIQSQVLNLLMELQRERGLSYMFIAHDLSVVRHISDRVAVMYLGKVVEFTGADAMYTKPLHPYTQALMTANPLPDPENRNRKRRVLEGDVPSPISPPRGCRFHTRCPFAQDICKRDVPELKSAPGTSGEDHLVACHFAGSVQF